MFLTVEKQDVVLSGSFGRASTSARAGYLPICLERAPLAAFAGIAIYLRSVDPKNPALESFRLYCSSDIRLTRQHHTRLTANGTKFVYIAIADHERFRRQVEESLLATVADPTIETSIKSEIVYETSVELINELLSEPDFLTRVSRLDTISRAITMLVLNDPGAFPQLFAASHHDFYTATHMVNVGTWMVPLAYALGYRDPEDLNVICQAGLLHDVGKVYIPPRILNKKAKLTEGEWELIRRHPELGCEHLNRFGGIDPVVFTVAHEHHERIDGSGYPQALQGDQIHAVSKICAVVDSFDAMTAFRPYKSRAMSVGQALTIITRDTPHRYDPKVVDAWLNLLQQAERDGLLSEQIVLNGEPHTRQFPRFPIECPARLHILDQGATGGWTQRPAVAVTAHNISRGGAGFVSQQHVRPGERVRLHFRGEQAMERTDDGIIVRCRAYRDGFYEVGMKFTDIDAVETPSDAITDNAA